MPPDPFDPDTYLERGSNSEHEEPDFDVGTPDPAANITDTSEYYDDVDVDLRNAFWMLVIVFNISLFTVSLGFMLLYFRGDLTWGGLSLSIGVFLGIVGLVRYSRVKRQLEAGAFDLEPDTCSADESTGKREDTQK